MFDLAFRFFIQNPTPFINRYNYVGFQIKSINDLVRLILPILYLAGAFIFGGMLIWAAYLIITAGGEAEKVQAARNTATYAVIGILIILLAALIVQILSFVLGLNAPV